MGQEYQAQYISTIGIENKKKVLEIDGKQILVKVWDTAGQERFGAIAKRYYKGADGILLVYDITSQRKYF
jgi:small GTP-binding protein